MRTAAIAVTLFFFGMLTVCGTAAGEMQPKSQSEKADVFAEVKEGGAIPKGFVELTIKANIKTHSEGYYLIESKESFHGKEKYPFLVSIDGQTARWEVSGVGDIQPQYDDDGKTSRNPEAGEGFKYVLEKNIRLHEGPHKVIFDLPEDQYVTEAEISLKEGDRSVLEFKPVYRTKLTPTRIPSFVKGVERYDIFLNGEPIQQ